MEKIFNSEKELRRVYGQQADKIKLRMIILKAARNLAMVPVHPPDRRHALSGDHVGQFAVDLKHPYRLIFEPADQPLPEKADGSIDLERVVTLRILNVEDYH
jgi:proteic killer suppression protein